jgi:hypothetical protein
MFGCRGKKSKVLLLGPCSLRGCDESDQRNQGETYHRCTLDEPTLRHIGTFAFAS